MCAYTVYVFIYLVIGSICMYPNSAEFIATNLNLLRTAII